MAVLNISSQPTNFYVVINGFPRVINSVEGEHSSRLCLEMFRKKEVFVLEDNFIELYNFAVDHLSFAYRLTRRVLFTPHITIVLIIGEK